MSLTWSEYRYLLMENNLPLLVYAADQLNTIPPGVSKWL